ncbi:leucine-rich repeat receptor protein kinase HPCA1-like [Bidens hawaiensis]|uniref:leucine-rich repeat receptor protein kinase HPCA1-like n=1 Tax=Bidens hawaiensis TaxID=980011 RepID=UPI00404B76FF
MMGSKIGKIFSILCIIVSIISAQDNDLANLHALKNAWYNTPPTWDDGSHHCYWLGITCTNGRVSKITLPSMELRGELPEHIWDFTQLQILDLSYNKGLIGSVTFKVENLRKLTHLFLVGCSFTGPIPDTIGNLENLISLSLNSNSFTGPIPASIGNLRNLDWLDLTSNKLTGSIPVSKESTSGLDMLTKTKHFHLGDNQLSGDIPPGLFNSNMTMIHLLLENNRLTGAIPSTLSLVTSLQVLRFDRNSLSGNVPSNINNLTNLQQIFLSHNKLTGPLPNLTGMNVLNYIDFSNNTFDDRSEAPSWFSTLEALTTIKMNHTNLRGELPAALFSKPQLQNVDLSHNSINGTLNISSNPSTQLQLVDLRDNQIDDFTQRSKYKESIGLILADNPICRESDVTDQFCSPQTNITTYSTPWNYCQPPSCGLGQISSPNCQCACPYIGSIFFKFPSFSSLENSTIYNSLHDSLMTFFHEASFPVNSLSLQNPRRNADDYLVIDLKIFPSGEPSFNRTGILGLAFALGNQTFQPPKEFSIYYFIPESYSNFWKGNVTKHKSSKAGIITGSVAGGCVLVVLFVLAGMHFFHQKERAERPPQQSKPFALWDSTTSSGGVPQLKGARSFTFEELQNYTNNFSAINNIGKGGYGMVYKGILPNGQQIAVKRAQKGSSQGGLEFKTEIELLSRVHHKNVVGFIGFCFDQGEQMLIYEYIVNGTLKDSLSGGSGIRLDWMQRLKIALGAARGLQYLHDHADPPIIHRDVKTNNILLDEQLVAKVADFGLSKPLSDADGTHVTTQVKGTMGYMDPEYCMTQLLTAKSDTYSFGIVMLELITARNPIEKGKYIVTEVKESMKKNKELYDLQDILDPVIGSSSPLKGLEKFVDIALRCVEDTRNLRPTMSEVVKELEYIMEMLVHSSSSLSTSASYGGWSKEYSNDSVLS